MTETEAKEKVCHIMPEFLCKSNLNNACCIGSKCMSWQKYEPPDFKYKADEEFKKSGRSLYNPHGYCSQGAQNH